MASSALSPSHERISIPTIWVAFGLSVFLHGVWLFAWVQKPVLPFEEPKLGQPSNSLAIRLVPLTSPPVQPPLAPRAQPAPDPAARARPSAPRIPVPPRERAPTKPSPPVIALERSTPSPVSVPPPPEAPKPAPGEDLAAYIASRRSAREGTAAPAAPTESEQQRHNRVVAENLGLANVPSFGNDPDRGGGVFQVRSMGYDIAEFSFYGWNNAIKRSSLQLVEVRRGSNPNMEIAVVRRMIEIIRERYNADFQWQSRRLGRSLTLSARPGDTAGLEDFLLKEIFPPAR